MLSRFLIPGSAFFLLLGCADSSRLAHKSQEPPVSIPVPKPKTDTVQARKQTVDSVPAPFIASPVDTLTMKRQRDSVQSRLREEGIELWAARVRATVEPNWILPKNLSRHRYRVVVLLRIGRGGDLRGSKWIAERPSRVFNNLAARALKKTKRYPVFPAAVPDTVLEIQYEFVTSGKSAVRRKLMLRGSPPS